MTASVQRIPGVPPRRTAVFDMALGILMALTGADPVAVKTELVRRGHVDVFHLAAALVGYTCDHPTADPRARDLVAEHWGPRLDQLPRHDRGTGLADPTTPPR